MDDDFALTVANWSDAELIDTWDTASEAETENLSPFLLAVVEEMSRRGLSL